MHFGEECGVTLVVWYGQRVGGRLVICNNYIKNVSDTDLKWNKHECVLHPNIMLPLPFAVPKKLGFWEYIITCFILGLAYKRLKLCLRQASPRVVAKVHLCANIGGTYHKDWYLRNGCSWTFMAILPNLSNVTSKLFKMRCAGQVKPRGVL